ncbi:MAG: acetyl-CoA carboxylase biotin carboxyl carrier protein subunit [Bacteroidales bacterium]|nr:acetyl-CoA carboxylase biotin carboxyl carrier protein subunit [Bacteroidales bacterium]MDP2235942.1 acetyl-CoA carboxylase biotin carboxyl carrier protein subunit [Bacteroidales bacterium]
MKKAKKIDAKDNNKPELDTLVIDNVIYQTTFTRKYVNKPVYSVFNPNLLVAFIPGTITEVYIKEGESVTKGQQLAVLEAMKMLNEIVAPFDGVVKKLNVNKGDRVTKNHVIIELE